MPLAFTQEDFLVEKYDCKPFARVLQILNETIRQVKLLRIVVNRFNDDGSGCKAALLSGPPGVGKTTTATIVCKVRPNTETSTVTVCVKGAIKARLHQASASTQSQRCDDTRDTTCIVRQSVSLCKW